MEPVTLKWFDLASSSKNILVLALSYTDKCSRSARYGNQKKPGNKKMARLIKSLDAIFCPNTFFCLSSCNLSTDSLSQRHVK